MSSSEPCSVYIGLEIHIHLKTQSKMFCSCAARYGDEPNANVCPVCLGYPGALPQANGKALYFAYLIARALNCQIAERTSFDRKNYFYPDMPKNYQISQYENPIGRNGSMEVDYGEDNTAQIRIHDVHLEEDAGKMVHGGDVTLLDFNRAGYPLLEIVTEPDLHSGKETEKFLRSFQRIIRYLDVSDGNMDEGSMKCDANISINRPGAGLGAKVELKNMNSPRFVRQALNYEIIRQADILQSGKEITQETRLWNENRDITQSMREKEGADDYRYFPEPDLPPFVPDKLFLESVDKAIVELPLTKMRRLQSEYGITAEQSEFIHDDLETASFFEATAKLGAAPKLIAAWLGSDIKKHLNNIRKSISDSCISPVRLNSLIKLIESGKISGKIAKKVLTQIFERNEDPQRIVEANNWFQISDETEITKIVEKVLDNHANVVKNIKLQGDKQQQWLMGQIMKESEGRISPGISNRILNKLIAERLDSLERPAGNL